MSCNRPVCGRRTDVRRKVCPNGYNRRISDRRMTVAPSSAHRRFAELLNAVVILVRREAYRFPLRKTRLELPICSIVPTSVVRTERPVPETTGIVTVRTVFPHGTVVARKIRVVRCARTAVRRVLRIGGITLQTRATLDTLRRGNTRPLIAPEAGQRRIRVVFEIFHNRFCEFCEFNKSYSRKSQSSMEPAKLTLRRFTTPGPKSAISLDFPCITGKTPAFRTGRKYRCRQQR